MPRFAFNKSSKDSTSTIERVESPITRSSPRRTARSTPESKPQQKPVSILRSKRYGISVQPDSDNDEEFPSDSPFFKAAQEALTQEGYDKNKYNDSGDSDGEEDEEVVKISQKKEKTLAALEKLKKKYTDDLAAGIQTPEVLRGSSTADTSVTVDSAEWARKAYASAHRVNRSSVLMSPSELSPASTIVATPASQRSDKMTPSTRKTILDEVMEDDEFGVHDDDDSEEDAPIDSSNAEEEHTASIMEKSVPPDTFEQSDHEGNEGEGFQLNSETNVESDEEERKMKKITKKNKQSFVTPDNRDEGKKRGRPKKVKISTNVFNVGHQVGNRDYIQVPVDELAGNSSDDEDGTRRSKRRRIAPLAFWKNERPLYTANNASGKLAEVFGDMPFVSGIQKALPTPYKKRVLPVKKKKVESDSDDDSEPKPKKHVRSKIDTLYAEVEEFDASELKKKYSIIDGVTASVWDENNTESVDMKVFCYKKNLAMHSLPQLGNRKSSEGKVTCKAAQAFNKTQEGLIPGYIVGCLELPPKGIKDPESVGPCCQIFNVGDCQPKSVEIAIANPDVNDGNYDEDSAQRFLLSKNDSFHLPPGNVYRIQNHSKTTTCILHWTIIQPFRES